MVDPKKLLPKNQGAGSVPEMFASLGPMSSRKEDYPVILAITEEIARADGWNNLEECFCDGIEVVNNYMTFADAALRAMKRFQLGPRALN